MTPQRHLNRLLTAKIRSQVKYEKIKTQVKGDPEADDEFFVDIMDYEATNAWEARLMGSAPKAMQSKTMSAGSM